MLVLEPACHGKESLNSDVLHPADNADEVHQAMQCTQDRDTCSHNSHGAGMCLCQYSNFQ